jgi:hypothetical protein
MGVFMTNGSVTGADGVGLTKKARIFILCSLLLIPAGYAAESVKPLAVRLPVNAVVLSEDESGAAWRQNCRLGVSYVAAVKQLKAVIGQQGWQMTKEFGIGAQNDRCLLTFSRGKTEITVMVWKVGVAETQFSWGIAN